MSINDNFGRNRSKFRRVYAYGANHRPDMRSFVDALTNTTKSLDFQKVIRDRDYFLINGYVSLTFPTGSFQYWESTQNSTAYADYIDISFPVIFDGIPIVGFALYPEGVTASGSNVAYWATNITSFGFKANFSGPFSGTLLYRAVYNPGTYPIYVERTPGSGNFAWVSAASSSYAWDTETTMSFATLPGKPESVLSNPIGTDTDYLLNIGQAYASVGTNFITNIFSSAFSGSLDLVAISTVPTGSPQPVDPP